MGLNSFPCPLVEAHLPCVAKDDESEPILEGNMASAFSETAGKTSWAGVKVDPNETWKAKDIVQNLIGTVGSDLIKKFTPSTPPRADELPDVAFILGQSLGNERKGFESNFWAFQKSWSGVGGWDVAYELGEFDGSEDVTSNAGRSGSCLPCIQPLPYEKSSSAFLIDPALSSGLLSLAEEFSSHLQSRLPIPPTSPYASPRHIKFASEITSNLLGGVGYFSGRSLIDRSFAQEYDEQPEYEEGEEGVRETEAKELLTATPSRSFFPRGFYWDEGFHLLLIGEWDNDLRSACPTLLFLAIDLTHSGYKSRDPQVVDRSH